MSEATEFALHADQALLDGGWAHDVRLGISAAGNITEVATDGAQLCDNPDRLRTTRLRGCALPGVANLHSHAHQRAMAGLAERAGETHDSFWSWRERMYQHVGRLHPHQLQAIAAQLYVEMLKAGYTCVGEFQYLHHQIDGSPYDDRSEMTQRCLSAANDVGLGFTALPVLYRFGGFGSADPVDGQKRFLNDADGFIEIVNALQKSSAGNHNASVGIAPHSLRAIDKPLLGSVLESLGIDNLAAVHVHIAEQTKEVDDCLAWSGKRPVEWLYDEFDVNHRWCLIHATHMTSEETQEMAKSGAVAGLCPTTEGNLGDGFFNAVEYFDAKGHWAIGSDSHISIDPVEELRWLEYGQRLMTRGRNVLTSSSMANTGRNLIDQMLVGSELSMGRKIGKISKGYRADMLVLDDQHSRLVGRSQDELLDSWIFSGNDNPVSSVIIAGDKRIESHQHVDEVQIEQDFAQTLKRLSEK